MKWQISRLHQMAENTSKKLKRFALTAFTITALSVSASSIAAAESLSTVYYIYVDNSFVGVVSDKALVENLVQEKVSSSEESYNHNLQLTLGTKITYIPEQVFEMVTKKADMEVLNKLENILSIEALASELSFGDKSIYLKDEASAEQVVEALKLKYVSKEELQQLENTKRSGTDSLPPLKENESRLLDVRLSEDVTISTKKVAPEKILTVEQAVDYITKGTLEEKKYIVQEGDVLGKIANDHGMTLKQLLAINPDIDEDAILSIGQEINITMLEPLVNVIIEKEVFKKETIPYQTEIVEDSSMYKGDTKVKQEGREGSREVTYKISVQNGVQIAKEVVHENVTKEPVNKVVLKGTKVIPSRGTGSFAWPTNGGYISSYQGYRWGAFHKGIDIARPSNRTIKAADNGKVVFAGWDGGYGKKVIVDHQNGYRTVYAHLSSISVSVGDTVPKGSKLGIMGSTGNSTGIHLHFEIYKNGVLQNPMDYLR